jgi:NAD(P)-dependent dehydrogenase (short-subunit alcohol dehydrogenase family)
VVFAEESLRQKVVLVAGATGAVGGAVAAALLQRGARVALVARHAWQVPKLQLVFGRERVLCGHVGAQDSEAAAGFVKGTWDALGPIDALICANGAFGATAAGKDQAGDLQGLLEANLLTGANLARAVIGRMQRRGAGSLVFVGSDTVGSGGKSMTNYLASKAALHEYVRAMSFELRGSGIRVVALVPGVIDTKANRAAMPLVDPSQWVPLVEVANALLQLAFAPLPDTGPLYPPTALR